MKKNIIIIILIFVLFIPSIVLAKDKIEFDKLNKLNIEYYYNDIVLKNAKFNIYHIADIDEDNNYTFTPIFENYNVVVSNENMEYWSSNAETFKSYILRDGLEPDYSYVTDNTGQIYINKLPVGLYLVISDKLSLNGYTYMAKPFLVSMPIYNIDKDRWDYDIISIPKVDREKEIPEEERYTSKRIIIAWNDNENKSNKRPKQLTVKLLRDGEVIDEAILSDDNNWEFTWSNLEVFAPNYSKIVYTIVQDDVKEYNVKIDEDGSVFSIVNTYIEEEKEEERLPQTGVLWYPIPILFIIGLLFVRKGIKCNRIQR